jgi:hypothetical protein
MGKLFQTEKLWKKQLVQMPVKIVELVIGMMKQNAVFYRADAWNQVMEVC